MDWLAEFLHQLGISDPSGYGWVSVVITFVLAAGFTAFLIPRVLRFALQAGWADLPNERRLNARPLPNVGGLAIYAGVVTALLLATLMRPEVLSGVRIELLAILLGGSILVLTGFIDDQFGLPPVFRLAVQILAALLLFGNGIKIEAAFGTPLDPTLSLMLTVGWVVGITNAVNLLDGLDGLAGGVSLITALALLAVAAQFPDRGAAVLILAALAGSALSFLNFNLHPSRIIMGDAGAYFLGYVLAAATILGGLKLTTAFSLVPPVLFLLIPVLDTAQVIIRRTLKGQNPLSHPGKDHLHHQLLRRGFSQPRVTRILWGLTLIANIAAMTWQGVSWWVIGATALVTSLLLALAAWGREIQERQN